MQSDTDIRKAQERVIAVFRRSPQTARFTNRTVGRLQDGLACTVSEGDESVVVDMPADFGGGGSAPGPGFHARAGLASCIAIGIKMAATREAVSVQAVEVRLETDFDNGALFGLGPNAAGPQAVRVAVRIETGAPAERVAALVDAALAQDPWFLALREANDVSTTTEVAAA